jgi:levanase/fructan beta-fructosidase
MERLATMAFGELMKQPLTTKSMKPMKKIVRPAVCLLLLSLWGSLPQVFAVDDMLINDFEAADYGDWTVEGDAFGTGPAKGTLPGQMHVSGFEGDRLVNSFLGGDKSTGKLTSPEFAIQRDYIKFLIGGGGHKGETCINLVIDGNIVATATGPNSESGGSETLQLAFWEVGSFKDKSAVIQIVDEATGGWGHINVDQIVQTDTKPEPPGNPWSIGAAAAPPYDPYTKPYQEKWRPQFHFSPKVEWMNDINALVYQDGVYHMIYQWGKSIRHGGYATSSDLVHWDDKGVALVPQGTFLPAEAVRNVSGHQVYSGSGILVSGETALRITGSTKPALVTFYTGTKVGTCIAWSNDEGQTWHNYKENPVANPTVDATPRDPCVIWYEPTKTWILGIYEKQAGKNGTGLYGSKDLINWEKLSFLDFGFECPDIVELPLDGNPDQMKWVIYDAAGEYLVGRFDGRTFTDENRVDDLFMDVGPDFYAGQTFFPHNLPEKKYIQIAWMDEWNGGIGEEKGGWERNATFPVELGLVTRDGKMRLTRTPIAAIEKLYTGQTVTISNVTVGAQNLLDDVRCKTFDATLTFDLNGATADEIVFRITDVTYRYNVAEQKLYYNGVEKNSYGSKLPPSLKPDANKKLTIRMLVDWSSIELFSDEGVFSLTHHVAFDPNNDSLGLSATGGEVKLESLVLNPIKSIWE